MVVYALYAVAALLIIAPLAVAGIRSPRASQAVYGASLIITIALCVIASLSLFSHPTQSSAITLPLGLPWLGAHFRIDTLSAFFLVVVNLGGAAASLFALGYGRHEHSPERVLPFYPVYLAAMNLVVLANDAFSFLVSWEFMSLTSWALVIAHHELRENMRAGYIYLLMASFGTLTLLLAFGLLVGAGGDYVFDAIRATNATPELDALVLI
ncbi:MAG: proton-conducting transporter transmembrane domain-containing protein, partial [Xanthobacteraceae bacterium]